MVFAGPASAFTLTWDCDVSEFTGPEVTDLGTRNAPDGGTYQLLAASDAANLYLGMERGNTSRYLDDGDGWGLIDSFFVAIDVDGVAGSGATGDGYGRVNFGGTYLPDFFLYYAGGPHWHESSAWNGSGHDWLGWTQDGASYGNPGWGDDDEFAIGLDGIGGGDGEVMVWAWMTREGNGWIEAAWGFDGGDHPTAGDGIMLSVVPEPATMALLGLGSLAVFRRKR